MKLKKIYYSLPLASVLAAVPVAVVACGDENATPAAKLATQAEVNAEQLVVNAWSQATVAVGSFIAETDVVFDQTKATALGFGTLELKTDQFDYKVSHAAKASSGPLALTITVYAKGSMTVKGTPVAITVNVQMPVSIDLARIDNINALFTAIGDVAHFKQSTTFAQIGQDLGNGDTTSVAAYFSGLNRISALQLNYNGQSLPLLIDLGKVKDDFAAGLRSGASPKFTVEQITQGAMTNPLVIASARINLNDSMSLTSFALTLPAPCWDAYMELLDLDNKFITTIANSPLYTSWLSDKHIPANPFPIDWAVVSTTTLSIVGRPSGPIIPLAAQFIAWILDMQYDAS